MKLIFFTKEYPFGKTETYIRHQLEAFSEQFEHIYIVPYWVDQISNQRPIPQNSTVIINERVNLRFFSKVKRDIYCILLFYKQIINGNDCVTHLRNCRKFFILLRTLYSLSTTLKRHIFHPDCLDLNQYRIHDYWLHNGIITSIFLEKLLNTKIKTTCQAHSLDLYHSDWRRFHPSKEAFLPFEYIKMNHVNQVFSISEHGTKFLSTKYPRIKDKFQTCRLGTKDYCNGKDFSKKNKFRDEFTIVSCSHLTLNKRIHLIPAILSRLTVKFTWYHFGDGNEDMLNLILDAVKKEKIEENVKLLGWQRNDDIIKFYQNHEVDFIINVSKAEGIPVSMMEAASFGIPLLGTDTVGVPEIVTSETGILVPVDFNPFIVGTTLNSILNNPSKLNHLKKGARKMYLNRFHASHNFKALATKIISAET